MVELLSSNNRAEVISFQTLFVHVLLTSLSHTPLKVSQPSRETLKFWFSSLLNTSSFENVSRVACFSSTICFAWTLWWMSYRLHGDELHRHLIVSVEAIKDSLAQRWLVVGQTSLPGRLIFMQHVWPSQRNNLLVSTGHCRPQTQKRLEIEKDVSSYCSDCDNSRKGC